MTIVEELLQMWQKDCEIDRTEPSKALLDIPKFHSKYLAILSKHRMLSKECEFRYIQLRKLKWEYYTGKLDEKTLAEKGWEPFPYVLKAELNTYLESDEELVKITARKSMHDEVVELCISIMKELNSRTFQLRSFIDYEKFIHGI